MASSSVTLVPSESDDIAKRSLAAYTAGMSRRTPAKTTRSAMPSSIARASRGALSPPPTSSRRGVGHGFATRAKARTRVG
jgi:hypothetical protein